MEQIGTVKELWRYPGSSLGGEELGALSVDAGGVVGDRLFGLVERSSGKIARPEHSQWNAVPRIRARLRNGQHPEIATPDSAWLPVPSPEADQAASAYLGFDAAIRLYSDEGARPPHEGPLAVNRYKPAPVHLLTTASQARLEALHPSGKADVRRFRPNILVEMAPREGAFPETEWIGQTLQVGALRLRISEAARRCGFTVIAQDGVAHDPGILRSLVRFNKHNMGVYCTVEQAGTLAVGDPVLINGAEG